MLSTLLSLWMAFLPLVQQPGAGLQFDVRARQNLLFGKGQTSGAEYYDVVITGQPSSGILIKLPYTRKGGKFSFDIHHRIAMTDEFGLPAEVTTVVEVISGGTTSLGVFTISDKINPGARFDETITRVSDAEIDRFVTPFSRKTVSIATQAGPQSVSIVGQAVMITRGDTTTRIDTPGTRIASVSNFKFVEATDGERLTID